MIGLETQSNSRQDTGCFISQTSKAGLAFQTALHALFQSRIVRFLVNMASKCRPDVLSNEIDMELLLLPKF